MMTGRILVLGVIFMVALAGCNALPDSQGTTRDPDTTSMTAASTQSTPSTSTTTTPSTTTQEPLNPWGSESLQVYVESELSDRNYSSLAAKSLSFWNNNASGRSGVDYRIYPKLTLTDSPDAADVIIQYRPVLECQGVTGQVGDVRAYCSEYYDDGDTASETTKIVVTSRYENETTIRLTTNALGGLYGRTSTSPPVEIQESPNLTDPFITADTVVVAIHNEVNSRNFTPMVQQALKYWMANDENYATYTTEFRLDPNAEDPDLVVHIRENVSYCGLHDRENVIGCADILNKQHGKEIPVRVVIKSGFTDASTVTILKHELGHVYGLEHGDTPGDWMQVQFDVDELPQADAQDQVNPWSPNPVTIAIDNTTYHDPEQVEEGLQHVINHYNELAPGGFQLRLVEDPAMANIVVREVPPRESECLDPGIASCGMPYGYSTDEDRALEEYDKMIIHTNDVDADEVAWHVGYWIDRTVTPGGMAEYWDDPDSDDRTKWW